MSILPNFPFVISTLEHDASKELETKTLVRKHVMRRFKKLKTTRPVVRLEGEALREFLSRRHREEQQLVADGSYLFDYDPRLEAPLATGSPRSAASILGATRSDPFSSYPIPMTPKDHELVSYIWARDQYTLQPFRNYWFTLGMMDPAAMHLVLSNAAVRLNAVRGNNDENIPILFHNSRALESLNHRLTDPKKNLTDGILGAVIGLLGHYHLISGYDGCARHMNGLQEMIRLRGGLSSIDQNPYIRLSLFWIEYSLCANQDIVPKFAPPVHLFQCPYSVLIKADAEVHRDEAIQFSGVGQLLSRELMEIITDISHITKLISDTGIDKIRCTNPNFAGFGILPLMYKLLSIQTRHEHDVLKGLVQELYRLGIILFLAEIRRMLGSAFVVTCIHYKKLWALLESSTAWVEDIAIVRNWVLVVAGSVARTREDRTKALKAMMKSGTFDLYSSWEDMMVFMSRMWWMDDILAHNVKENFKRDVIETLADYYSND